MKKSIILLVLFITCIACYKIKYITEYYKICNYNYKYWDNINSEFNKSGIVFYNNGTAKLFYYDNSRRIRYSPSPHVFYGDQWSFYGRDSLMTPIGKTCVYKLEREVLILEMSNSGDSNLRYWSLIPSNNQIDNIQ